MRLGMQSLFARAANLLQGPENYSPKADSAVILPGTSVFSLTGLLERANCRANNTGFIRGDADVLARANWQLCGILGVIHLDGWEREQKPDWQRVKAILLDASHG